MEKLKDLEKLSRKEKEHLFRHRQILDAALKLFAVKGYSGTSMQEIAAASEFSIGTLYNFFSTKEELFLSLLEEKFIESRSWIEGRTGEEKDYLDKVHVATESTLAFMDQNREFFTLFLAAQTAPDMTMHERIHERFEHYYDLQVEFMTGIMEGCVREGLFRTISPKSLAQTLIGITNSWIYHWLKGPGDKQLQEQHEFIIDLFLNGAMAKKAKGNKS